MPIYGLIWGTNLFFYLASLGKVATPSIWRYHTLDIYIILSTAYRGKNIYFLKKIVTINSIFNNFLKDLSIVLRQIFPPKLLKTPYYPKSDSHYYYSNGVIFLSIRSLLWRTIGKLAVWKVKWTELFWILSIPSTLSTSYFSL